jgi:hypothetical protein
VADPVRPHPQTIIERLHRDIEKIRDGFVHTIARIGDRAQEARREPPHLAFGMMRQLIAETDGIQTVLLLCPDDRFEPARAALYAVRENLRALELAAAKAVADMRKAEAAAAARAA